MSPVVVVYCCRTQSSRVEPLPLACRFLSSHSIRKDGPKSTTHHGPRHFGTTTQGIATAQDTFLSSGLAEISLFFFRAISCPFDNSNLDLLSQVAPPQPRVACVYHHCGWKLSVFLPEDQGQRSRACNRRVAPPACWRKHLWLSCRTPIWTPRSKRIGFRTLATRRILRLATIRHPSALFPWIQLRKQGASYLTRPSVPAGAKSAFCFSGFVSHRSCHSPPD